MGLPTRQEFRKKVTPENRPHGTLFALALIIVGVLLFLDNLGALPIGNLGALWPLTLVFYGAGAIWYKRTVIIAIWSGTLIVAGFLLVMGNLRYLHVTVLGLWPLLLIALGATLLADRSILGKGFFASGFWAGRFPQGTGRDEFRHRILQAATEREQRRSERWRLKQERWQRRGWGHQYAGSPFEAKDYAKSFTQSAWSEGHIHEVAVFFGARRRVESQDFQGGDLFAAFGSIELDLTFAAIQDLPDPENAGAALRRAILNASALFGGIEIAVPRNWRVIREGSGAFGSYEDKTFPRPDPGTEPATLIVRGGAIFGSVTIRN